MTATLKKKRVAFSPEEDLIEPERAIRTDDASAKHQNGLADLYDPAKLTRPVNTVKDKYELLPAFLQVRGLVKQHLGSFNYLINHELRNIITHKDNCRITSDVDSNWYCQFTDITVGMPEKRQEDHKIVRMNPQQCRLRDSTYSAEIRVDLEFIKGQERIIAKGENGKGHTAIGRIPIMLRSDRCWLNGKTESELATLGECPLDPGGYFIVRGTEKVLLIQEQLSKNRVLIDVNNKGEVESSVTSSTHDRRSQTRVSWRRGVALVINTNFLTDNLNVAVAFKAMGIESDQEIIQMVGPEPAFVALFMPTLQECKQLNIHTQQQALEYMGGCIKGRQGFIGKRTKSKADEAREQLRDLVFSHVLAPKFNFQHKAIYTALVIRRMLNAKIDPAFIDDRDYHGNKRLELAGGLLGLLFEDLFKRLLTELKKEADKRLGHANKSTPFDVTKLIRQDTITLGLESAISSGNWNIKRFKMDRKGVSQPLNRLSFIAAIGMMTRMNSQFEKSRKVSGPRSLQPSQWGMLCPADTPEGESCGLVKNLAMMTHVTTDEEEEPLKNLAYNFGVQPAFLCSPGAMHQRGVGIVHLNGIILGTHNRPLQFVNTMRQLRRRRLVGEFVSVYTQYNCVHIASDGGRVCRPLIICEKGIPKLTAEHTAKIKSKEWGFADLLERGLVEYLDVNEENNALIALYEKNCNQQTTHLEIEPFTILGVVAGLIPYPHHNQSPRNTYQCAMGKQAMGNFAYNQLDRLDTLQYLLVYPQRPLLTTKTIELVGFDKLGAGQNATVAVMSYSGYDIEDAIVMNKASLDRGFGRCMVRRRMACTLKKYPNRSQDRITAPPQTMPERSGRFRLLEQDGICAVGEGIQNDDIYINKSSPKVTRNTGEPIKQLNAVLPDSAYTPTPQRYKGPVGETCVVDKVMLTTNDEDCPTFKVLIRHTRRPEIGDKFSSRHGQKGVVGNIVSQEDLPFSERGICPDLIMNPHGFPSRMTVGKMIELLGSKAGACNGKFHYGTAFGEETGLADNVQTISETLIRHGFNYSGKDMLTNGTTGEPLEANIFMGPVYYQKLKHMVVDKIHARSRGPRVVMTRQPTEGRARDGGLRLGEMERDCLIGYGASMLLLERLMISSDQFEVHVCTHCGLLGYFDANTGMPCCPSTKMSTHMQTMKLPYACKLLFQELQSMNIAPRLTLSEA